MITIPRYILIENGALNKLDSLLKKLYLSNPIVICGNNTKKYAPNYPQIYYTDINVFDNKFLNNLKNYDSIIGVGGGRAIDTGKYIAYKLNKPFISIPTTGSNDGIASPVVSLKQPSIMAEPPICIVADISIIKKSPKRLLSAGFGDIVSNITAVLDWRLAHDEIGEQYSESSGIFSKTISEELINYVLKNDLDDYPKKLIKALVGSGITIAIANSTRPASGSEHLFSHALDYLKGRYGIGSRSYHGEQCGVGTIISSYIHYKEGRLSYEYLNKIKKSLEIVGAPTTAYDLGYDKDIIIEALYIAPKIRKRYTILRNGLSKEECEKILLNCGVI